MCLPGRYALLIARLAIVGWVVLAASSGCIRKVTQTMQYLPPDQIRSLSREQAIEAAIDFLDRAGLRRGHSAEELGKLVKLVRCDTDTEQGERWVIRLPLGRFEVSKTRGHIISFFHPPSPTKAPRLSVEECREIARRLIEKVYPDQDRRFVSRPVFERSEDFEFEFEEIKPDGATSIFPNTISVTVQRDTGDVSSYQASDLPFVRITPPKIDRAKVLEIIKAHCVAPHFEGMTWQFQDLELVERPVDRATRSITVWTVAIHYDKPETPSMPAVSYGDGCVINADTGEIVQGPTRPRR